MTATTKIIRSMCRLEGAGWGGVTRQLFQDDVRAVVQVEFAHAGTGWAMAPLGAVALVSRAMDTYGNPDNWKDPMVHQWLGRQAAVAFAAAIVWYHGVRPTVRRVDDTLGWTEDGQPRFTVSTPGYQG